MYTYSLYMKHICSVNLSIYVSFTIHIQFIYCPCSAWGDELYLHQMQQYTLSTLYTVHNNIHCEKFPT